MLMDTNGNGTWVHMNTWKPVHTVSVGGSHNAHWVMVEKGATEGLHLKVTCVVRQRHTQNLPVHLVSSL